MFPEATTTAVVAAATILCSGTHVDATSVTACLSNLQLLLEGWISMAWTRSFQVVWSSVR